MAAKKDKQDGLPPLPLKKALVKKRVPEISVLTTEDGSFAPGGPVKYSEKARRTKASTHTKMSDTVINGDANQEKIEARSEKELKSKDPYFSISRGGPGGRALSKYNRLLSAAMEKEAGDIGNSANVNFYSPLIPTDYLQMPSSMTERYAFYRNFYSNDPIVGRAIDLHTDLPWSKCALNMPRCKDPLQRKYVHQFFEDMVNKMDLYHKLHQATYDYNLLGDAFLFLAESPGWDNLIREDENYKHLFEEEELMKEVHPEFGGQYNVVTPGNIFHTHTSGEEEVRTIDETIKIAEEKPEKKKTTNELVEKYDKNQEYKGWSRITLFAPEDVNVKYYQLSDKVVMEFVPSEQTREIWAHAVGGDPGAIALVDSWDDAIKEAMEQARNIPLDTNPMVGSFCYHFANRRTDYMERGQSILERCKQTLVLKDKLRQAQSMIADRHMTPIRIVTYTDAGMGQVEELREQVDSALMDPDFTIISNVEITWNEIGSNERLLDLSGQFEQLNQGLYTGLGVTQDILTGTGSFGGERITLQVMETVYNQFRELITKFVNENIFKPVAIKKGFFELDEFGNKHYIYPQLRFSRLPLRDNSEIFEQLFNLNMKMQLPTSVLLDLLDLDVESVRDLLKEELFTMTDPNVNTLIQAMYGAQSLTDSIIGNTNLAERIANNIGLEYNPPPPEEGGEEGEGEEERFM